MFKADLREVDGTIMMVIPSDLMEQMHQSRGVTVNMVVEGQTVFMSPQRRPRYTLDELLAQCDPNAPPEEPDHEWLNMKPVGREII
jgi:antitoxin ChpS